MGQSTYQPPVLQNWRTAHALHNAACLGQQHRVRYPHNHILFAAAAPVADMNDLCLIQSGCVVAVHGGKQLAVSVLYLLCSRYRIGSHAFQRAAVSTKHTGAVIFCQRAQWLLQKITANGTGAAGLAFINLGDLSCNRLAP